jgi:hypothetical protein
VLLPREYVLSDLPIGELLPARFPGCHRQLGKPP